jgi:hypothetical protein
VLTPHALPAKFGTNFADNLWLLGRYSSLADYSCGVQFFKLVALKVN